MWAPALETSHGLPSPRYRQRLSGRPGMLPPVEAAGCLLEHRDALPAQGVANQAPGRGDALRLLESRQALDRGLPLRVHLAVAAP